MRVIAFVSIMLLTITGVIVSCNKTNNNDSQDNSVKQEIITGNIILPQGFQGNSEGWAVNSGFDESNIKAGKYAVLENSNGFNPQFVSDAQDNVILMGYSYPGQKDKTISAQSTVLAMTMLLPGVSSLNEQGKLNLINQIMNNPKFNEAVILLENQLSGGGKLFDTPNGGAYYEKITELFSSAAFPADSVALRIRSTENKNVNFIVSGKTVSFQNPGKAFNQMVGIYKNGSLIKRFTLPRYQYVATSITDGISNTFEPPDPIEEVYTFPVDGNYDVKIRTGKSLSDTEGKLAAVSNTVDIAIDWFINPYLNKKIDDAKVRQQCLKELGVSLTDFTTTLLQNASEAKSSVILEVASFGVTLIPKLLVCSNADLGNNPGSKYLNKWIKLTEFVTNKLTKTVYFATNTINLGIATYQWFNSTAAKDTCFKLTGNQLGKCEDCNLSSFTDSRDGKVYKTVQIGSQQWMAENLNYPVNDASSLGPKSWYYNGDPLKGNIYGRLYNKKAALSACPSGWHLPSDAEWTTMIKSIDPSALWNITTLNLSESAGGMMKSTDPQYWSGSNVGATNSSCFTALPGGYYSRKDDSFRDEGYRGYWWSSTSFATNGTYIYAVYSSTTDVRKYTESDYSGFSVRCVKD